ncbi:S-methyl-5-thioribose-1-phosphate isomerase [Bacteroidota bacterium]
MNVGGKPYQSIWPDPLDPELIKFVNQHLLPFEFRIDDLRTSGDALMAIRDMKVRGAPLIGVAGAFGVYLACLEAGSSGKGDDYLLTRAGQLRSSRPTAVNLAWAIDRVMEGIKDTTDMETKAQIARSIAIAIMEEEKKSSLNIGQHGLELIRETVRRKAEISTGNSGNETVNILTHCNAGWLACIDYGTALAPIYLAHDEGIPVHVWVDETRPRNQGARLTAWELGQNGIPHTVVVDNAGGHLMQQKMVDMVIVGSDRTTRNGDVANKIGTYLKALAAYDNKIPFYVALPSSSIDFSLHSGLDEIEIEERDPSEVSQIEGESDKGIIIVNILPPESPVSNYGFDITPARLVAGLITERGICAANEKDILKLFPQS